VRTRRSLRRSLASFTSVTAEERYQVNRYVNDNQSYAALIALNFPNASIPARLLDFLLTGA
jgi:hypothetical protein